MTPDLTGKGPINYKELAMNRKNETTPEALKEKPHNDSKPLIDSESLIEEVSIDGMCGVY